MSVREDKALIIVGISFIGGCLCFIWLLFLFLPSAEKPWLPWLVVSLISFFAIGLIVILVAFLIGNKTIMSNTFLEKDSFGRKRRIFKDDILLIVDFALGKGDHFYVIYPRGYDLALMKKQTSIYLSAIVRTKMIQSDKRLLIIRKTKKTEKAFLLFGYKSTLRIE